MNRDEIQFDYANAQYDDGGTGVSKDAITGTLFENLRSAAGELIPLATSDKVDFPEGPLTVSEIRVRESDAMDDALDITISTPDLTVGRQLSGGSHPWMVFNTVDCDYDNYRIGIEAR